jgi:hypothetical protein
VPASDRPSPDHGKDAAIESRLVPTVTSSGGDGCEVLMVLFLFEIFAL